MAIVGIDLDTSNSAAAAERELYEQLCTLKTGQRQRKR
jgi:hypothetical protein